MSGRFINKIGISINRYDAIPKSSPGLLQLPIPIPLLSAISLEFLIPYNCFAFSLTASSLLFLDLPWDILLLKVEFIYIWKSIDLIFFCEHQVDFNETRLHEATLALHTHA